LGGATPQAPRPAALFDSFETHPFHFLFICMGYALGLLPHILGAYACNIDKKVSLLF